MVIITIRYRIRYRNMGATINSLRLRPITLLLLFLLLLLLLFMNNDLRHNIPL